MGSEQFETVASRWDEMVAACADSWHVDPICTRSEWIAPLNTAFNHRTHERVVADDDVVLTFIEHRAPQGPILTGFDSVWGFATPMLGSDVDATVARFVEVFGGPSVHAIAVAGVSPDGPLWPALSALGPAGIRDSAHRCIADLSDGFDSWLERRSSRFRRSLRVAVRDCDAADIVIEFCRPDAAEAGQIMKRILAVERRSWKTSAGSGLVGTDLGRFTAEMTTRFASGGRARALFAVRDGIDVGYVVGAVVGDRYRGFQHSFDAALDTLSLGKALQWHNLVALVDEGVQTYDMGMHMGYKESYADRIESSATLVFRGSDLR